MTKKQVIEILKNHESGMKLSGTHTIHFVSQALYEEVATEIISLFHTGQTDVVIDPEKEMVDGFYQNPEEFTCQHANQTAKCSDCGEVLSI